MANLIPWIRRFGLSLGVLFASLLSVASGADDPTFREFPREEMPSPEALMNRLMELQFKSALTDDQRKLVEGMVRSAVKQQVDQNASTPNQTPLRQPEPIRDLAPVPQQDQDSSNSPPKRANQLQEEHGELRKPIPGAANSGRRTPSVDSLATNRSRSNESARQNASPPRATSHDESSSASSLTPPTSQAGRGPSSHDESSRAPFVTPPAPRDSQSQPPTPSDQNPPPWSRESLNRIAEKVRRERSKDNEAVEADPRPARITKKAIDDEINRIVMKAAQRALRKEPSEAPEGSPFDAASRESFLTPVVTRLQEFAARQDAGRQWRQFSQSRQRGRSDGAWNLRRRFDLPSALPGASSLPAIPEAGNHRSLLMPLGATLLALLILIPLWRRYRGRLVAFWKGVTAITWVNHPIRSPEDLVNAVDRFLVFHFGGLATWWHCRAVEQALVGLAPALSDDIGQLVAAYEVSRYGPQSRRISDSQLEQSALTLHQLAAASVKYESDSALASSTL